MVEYFRAIAGPLHREARLEPKSLLLGLPERFAQPLRSNARHVALKAGEILFNKGDVGDGCYWVEREIGRAHV